MSRFTRRLTTLRLEDAAGYGLNLTPTDGDFSSGEFNKENAEHLKVLDRDQHSGFVLGPDMVQDFSVTLQMLNQSLTHASQARVLDFIHRRGAFQTSATTSCDSTIWAWKTICTFNDLAGNTGTRTFPLCEGGESLAVGAPTNTITISGRNHAAPIDT